MALGAVVKRTTTRSHRELDAGGCCFDSLGPKSRRPRHCCSLTPAGAATMPATLRRAGVAVISRRAGAARSAAAVATQAQATRARVMVSTLRVSPRLEHGSSGASQSRTHSYAPARQPRRAQTVPHVRIRLQEVQSPPHSPLNLKDDSRVGRRRQRRLLQVREASREPKI